MSFNEHKKIKIKIKSTNNMDAYIEITFENFDNREQKKIDRPCVWIFTSGSVDVIIVYVCLLLSRDTTHVHKWHTKKRRQHQLHLLMHMGLITNCLENLEEIQIYFSLVQSDLIVQWNCTVKVEKNKFEKKEKRIID